MLEKQKIHTMLMPSVGKVSKKKFLNQFKKKKSKWNFFLFPVQTKLLLLLVSDIENENPNGEHGCEYENKRFDQNRFQMQTYSLRPECDQFGDYKIRQCKNGTL